MILRSTANHKRRSRRTSAASPLAFLERNQLWLLLAINIPDFEHQITYLQIKIQVAARRQVPGDLDPTRDEGLCCDIGGVPGELLEENPLFLLHCWVS
ncbi:Hypothetical predicted protein [Marmota monax]|uniref:Uncharacterized protein n=1 Tax=Marmota monax TaxID=9995 RepID=A0A5E4BY93_MARMO|nr:Hypothetical predicted protein [Marmota monax]